MNVYIDIPKNSIRVYSKIDNTKDKTVLSIQSNGISGSGGIYELPNLNSIYLCSPSPNNDYGVVAIIDSTCSRTVTVIASAIYF